MQFDTKREEAVYWRGAFVDRYATIEYCLTELLLRLCSIPAYGEQGKVPGSLSAKLKRLEKHLSVAGPLQAYSELLNVVISEMKRYALYRHTLVHGMMVAEPDESGLIGFGLYNETKGEGLCHYIGRWSTSEITSVAEAAGKLATAMAKCLIKVVDELALPVIPLIHVEDIRI